MTPAEKQEQMFARWLEPQGVEFAGEEAKRAYQERVTRFKDVIQLKKAPDRVPVHPMTGLFPLSYAGVTLYEAMHDYEKAGSALRKYVLELEPDAHNGMFLWPPGRFFELLDYRLYKWPGHGVPADSCYQYVEAEYMKAEEYDALINDPTDFWLRIYLPRIFGNLKPFEKLATLTDILELPLTCGSFVPFGLPDVQEALKAVMEAGSEALRWVGVMQSVEGSLTAHGFPGMFGGATKAPFDIIGDTLRGTHGILMDMYRRPDKLLEALERVTPLAIRMGVSMAKMSGNPVVFIPLHKGADGWLSDKQFKTFYWPTLKKVIWGLVEEGLVPFLFAEGGYNTRLEVIAPDLPPGSTIWLFDDTDMARAKEVLGKVACIAGNVPITLLTLGTPQEIKDYCRRLIEIAGKDGGFILSSGAVIDDIKPENVRALIEAAKEYGRYA